MVDDKLQADEAGIELGSEVKDQNLLVSRIGIAVVSEIGPNALEAERQRTEAARLTHAVPAQEQTNQAQEETKRDKFKVATTMGLSAFVVVVACVAVPAENRATVLEVCAGAAAAAWAGVEAIKALAKRKIGK